ncbi:MAG TPA: hypothetical protein V6C86_16660 [Oculatellaceae cyanobacterium]
MTVLIGTWEFEGPFENAAELRDEPAVYAILTFMNEEFELVELNEADNVQHTFKKLKDVTPADRPLSVAVYYCSDLSDNLREGLVEIILQEFDLSTDFDSATTAGCTTKFDSSNFLVAANQ